MVRLGLFFRLISKTILLWFFVKFYHKRSIDLSFLMTDDEKPVIKAEGDSSQIENKKKVENQENNQDAKDLILPVPVEQIQEKKLQKGTKLPNGNSSENNDKKDPENPEQPEEEEEEEKVEKVSFSDGLRHWIKLIYDKLLFYSFALHHYNLFQTLIILCICAGRPKPTEGDSVGFLYLFDNICILTEFAFILFVQWWIYDQAQNIIKDTEGHVAKIQSWDKDKNKDPETESTYENVLKFCFKKNSIFIYRLPSIIENNIFYCSLCLSTFLFMRFGILLIIINTCVCLVKFSISVRKFKLWKFVKNFGVLL